MTKKKIVAATGCPTGIAHTFMAAEALQKAAESAEKNYEFFTYVLGMRLVKLSVCVFTTFYSW